MPTAGATASEDLRALIAPLARGISGPVSALRRLQDDRDWIDVEVVEAVAHVFDRGRADVRGPARLRGAGVGAGLAGAGRRLS